MNFDLLSMTSQSSGKDLLTFQKIDLQGLFFMLSK